MERVDVKFESIEQINSFVNIVSKFSIPCKLSTNHSIVNAKSIMGILSLDLSKPLTFECDGEESALE